MNTRNTYHLTGTITTVSPFTVTPPSTSNGNRNNGGIYKNEHYLPRMNGKFFIPASSLRGKLRRLAKDVVGIELGRMTDGEYRFSLSDYHMATLGGVKQGKSEGAAENITDVRKLQYVRENNPLVSLFGCMDPLTVPGLTEIGHAIAEDEIDSVIIRQVRSNDLARESGAWEELDGDAYNELVEMLTEGRGKSGLKKSLESLQKEIYAEKDADKKSEMKEKQKVLKAEIDSNSVVSIQQPGLNYEAIPPNTTMNFRITLKKVNAQELSLFLRTIAMFGFNPVVGSHLSQGCGLISMKLNVMKQGALKLEKIGAITIKGDHEGAEFDPSVEALIVPLTLNIDAFSVKNINKK